jgi:hypothetical protein
MRHAHKAINDPAVIAQLLASCPVGRLATNGRDGFPVIKPVNFVFSHDKIYFHTGLVGEKIADIQRDNRVCFEVDLPLALVQARTQPCEASYLFRSVIIRGHAALIDEPEERGQAFQALMTKYQPAGGYGTYLDEKLKLTGIVAITIIEMTGKEELGKEEQRRQVLAALEQGEPLPLVL